jgi:hypothetical protein
VDLIVQSRVDAVAGQDHEADLVQRAPERLGEARPIRAVAVQERCEVERRDLVILVERVAFMLGQAIGVRLAHLVVAAEVLVERLLGGDPAHDPLPASGASGAVAPSALPSRQPFSAARPITAAA